MAVIRPKTLNMFVPDTGSPVAMGAYATAVTDKAVFEMMGAAFAPAALIIFVVGFDRRRLGRLTPA